MRLRMLAFAILAVDIGGGRMTGSAPWPVVHRVAPQPPGLGATAARIEYGQRCVVGEHLGRGEHSVEHQLMQRRQPPAGATDPIAQGGTVQRHALPCEDLCLAIQRQMLAELVDQHVRQQRLGCHAAVDRPLRRGGLHDGFLAGPAAITRPADHPDPQLRRDVVQHLGPVLADQVQRAAAAGADFIFDIDQLFDPRQVRRKRAAIASGRVGARRPAWRLRCRRLGRGHGRFHRGGLPWHRLLQVLDPVLQRFVAELLGTAAEAIALQRRDDQPLAFDLGQRRTQHLLQRRRIVGQRCGGGEHAPTLLRRCESEPMNPA